jgi:hypothetical protein
MASTSHTKDLEDVVHNMEKLGIKEKLNKEQAPLNFGVEFEFVLQLRKSDEDAIGVKLDHNTEAANKVVREHVADILYDAVDAKTSVQCDKVNESKFKSDFSKWYITDDQTIQERGEDKGNHSYGIEIISPALNFNQDKSFDEIRKACKAIPTSSESILIRPVVFMSISGTAKIQ